MKKLVSLLLVLLLCCCAALAETAADETVEELYLTPAADFVPTEEMAIGLWEMTSIISGGYTLPSYITGLEMTYEFQADGAGVVSTFDGTDTVVESFAWAYADGVVSVLDEEGGVLEAFTLVDENTLYLQEASVGIVLTRVVAEEAAQ